VAAASTAPLERALDRLLVIVLVAGPPLTGAITVTAWALAGAALRPVKQMAARADTISMSSPNERLPEPRGDDEIAQLGRTLNQMLGRIEATIAHERAFIDDASHELRTPLAVLRGELELAAQDAAGLPAVSAGLHSALEETDRLTRLAENLLMLARADAGQLQPGNAVADMLQTARSATARLHIPRHLSVSVVGTEGRVTAEPEWLGQIATNLLTNAIRHATSEVRIEVNATPGSVELLVADDGPGFPRDLLPVAFDRFIRADSARGRGGTGLGLAIVSSLVASLGGEVSAANGAPLGGATVRVVLPAAGEG
jgi:signal transduction histidine kinase